MSKGTTDLRKFDMAGAVLPTFEEVIRSKDWVFFGGDNLWPVHSVDYYNYSALNRACINAKRDAVIGKQMLVNGINANNIMTYIRRLPWTMLFTTGSVLIRY